MGVILVPSLESDSPDKLAPPSPEYVPHHASQFPIRVRHPLVVQKGTPVNTPQVAHSTNAFQQLKAGDGSPELDAVDRTRVADSLLNWLSSGVAGGEVGGVGI
jgi:hypothetical protein